MEKQESVRGWRLTVVAVACLVCAFVGISSLVAAQTPADTVSLGVSPQVLDLTANPGEEITNTFRLTNASDTSVDIETIPKNFTPRGEEGAVDLTVDDTSFSLADWIKVTPKATTLEPKKTQDFTVKISVPENSEPGSHFGSVVFKTIPPKQEGSGAAVSQEIAPVILVRVAGDVMEQADIESFKAQKSFYSLEDSVNFLSRIKNTGSVHFKPTGKVSIKNMFGNEVANIDLDRKNVLPDSIRQISSSWNKQGLKFGRYTATLTLVFGDNDQIKTAEYSFYYFPYQVILPFLLIIGGLLFVVMRYRVRLREALRVLRGKDQSK